MEFVAKHGKLAKFNIVEDMRQMLEGVDGQAELDMRPGEDIFTVAVRRLQCEDGWNLEGVPGETLDDKVKTIDNAAHTKGCISPEARHSARHFFEMVEGL